ncbi:DoxX family protein [Paenibacillus sp. N1-5-1-14]|uniref:DoxX family protein n=1 Tax=Paenibacillus radicibacter TaxID=2972488 RepID=UPI002159B15E|nr:DoxX family protein [Paenibacillus radicibacter]MCR8643281.1 DoxX family protein [Paenibacillus radicibacter]
MKKTTILYWVFTVLLVALMGMGAIPDMLSDPSAVALFDHLGYPAYLLPFIGFAKLLGVIAILVPKFSRIKEWAYAGFVFDLTGAMYSNVMVDGFASVTMFLIGYVVIAGSYIYSHKRQKARLLQTNGVRETSGKRTLSLG